MSQVLQRKEKECGSLRGKGEDEKTLSGKLETQIKELQCRLEEIDEDLEAERQGRARWVCCAMRIMDRNFTTEISGCAGPISPAEL